MLLNMKGKYKDNVLFFLECFHCQYLLGWRHYFLKIALTKQRCSYNEFESVKIALSQSAVRDLKRIYLNFEMLPVIIYMHLKMLWKTFADNRNHIS